MRVHTGFRVHRLLVAGIAALLGACGGDGSSSPDGSVVSDADDCPNVWTVVAGADTGASIQDGALVLGGTNLAGRDLQIHQDGLTGDFRIDVVIDSFVAGGEGAFVRAAVGDPASTRILAAGFDSFPSPGVGAHDLPNGQSGFGATTVTTGGVRITRTGAMVQALASTGDQFREVAVTDFTTGPVRVWFFLGSSTGSVGPTTTARIGSLVVSRGTGVASDAFDCDSLVP